MKTPERSGFYNALVITEYAEISSSSVVLQLSGLVDGNATVSLNSALRAVLLYALSIEYAFPPVV